MADVHIEGQLLRLSLSAAEKVEGVHADLTAPLSTVCDVEVLEDAHRAAGWRAGVKIGTRIPGILQVGRVVSPHATRFVAVHRDTPRGLRIRFSDGGVDEWIVGSSDPEAIADRITQARAR